MATKKTTPQEALPVIPGFKGFDLGMKCRDFQFKEGETYTHKGKAKACTSGFHFCENPLDVFRYYEPGTSVFHEVEGSGQIDRHNEDSKVASTEIKIGASIKLHDFIGLAVKFLFSRKAKAGQYGCIALGLWNSEDDRPEMRCAEIGCGDGSDGKLKADTWYRLDDAGQFVEVEQ